MTCSRKPRADWCPRVRISLVVLALVTATASAAAADSSTVVAPPPDPDPMEARVEALNNEILKLRDPEERTARADALAALGDSLEATGQTNVAVDCFRHAGWAAFRSGQVPTAAERWQHALELARTSDDPTRLGLALDSRAVGFAVQGDYDPALELWAEAIQTYRSQNDEVHESASLGNLANAYNITGRVPEAKATTERALTLARRSGNKTGISNAHHRLAGILHQMGELESALAQTDSALASSREDPRRLSSALIRRSTILWDLDRREDALAAIEEGVQVAQDGGSVRAARFAQANLALMLVGAHRPEEALRVIEQLEPEWRDETEIAGVQLDTIRGQALLQLGHLDEAKATLEATRNELEELRAAQEDRATAESLHQSAGEVYNVLTRINLEEGRVADAWAETERGRSAVLRELLNQGVGTPASLEEVQSVLAQANAALLQFSESGSQPLEAFIVTADEVRNVSAGHMMPTREIVRAALARMATGLSDEECRPALRRVGEVLLDDAVALIPDSITRLYIVAPTTVDNFPYGAIPYPNLDSPALSTRLSIAYVPGASSLPILTRREAATSGMTIFADPTLPGPAPHPADGTSESRGLDLSPLPHARDEAQAIAIRGARLLVGDAATSQALRDSPITAVLHFATHALVDVFRSDRSGLVLAGDDGLVSAPDVEQLNLPSDLVTLSGCRTNGGFQLTGEGTVGLTRAFLVAGSRTVITSLWDVRDDAAQRFMDIFYAELRAGATRDAALQQTREALRLEGFPLRDRAAFVITGVGHESVPVLVGAAGRQGSRSSWWPFLALAVAVLAAFLLLRRRASSETF